jgi:hypothetical protein
VLSRPQTSSIIASQLDGSHSEIICREINYSVRVTHNRTCDAPSKSSPQWRNAMTNTKCIIILLGYVMQLFRQVQTIQKTFLAPPLGQKTLCTVKNWGSKGIRNVGTNQTTRRHVQKNCNIHFHRHEKIICRIGEKTIVHLQWPMCIVCSVGQYIHLQWPICTVSSVGQYVQLNMTIFWYFTPCSLIEIYRCFGKTCCPHLLHWKWRQRFPPKPP